MTVKLVGSSSGSVALDAPASTTSGANIEFKLPVADGSANQLLKTDGSGNLGFANGVTTASGSMTIGFQDHVDGNVSSTTCTGYYERIGNMVHASFDSGAINLAGLNNGQILLVTGAFPITRDANWVMNGVATPVTVNSGANSGGPVIVPRYGYWLSNTSLYFSIPRNNSTADNLTVGMLNSGNSRFYVQYSYKVA
tara:strand:+ start:3306 stop:3893 length:588 start_codon:yes stop_codon:yes gene_type:complete